MVRDRGDLSGDFAEIAIQIETVLTDLNGKPVPMNIDGATAAFYGESGFSPELQFPLQPLLGYFQELVSAN